MKENEGKKKVNTQKKREKPLMIEFNKRRDDIVSHLKVTFVSVVKCRNFRDAIVYFSFTVILIVS